MSALMHVHALIFNEHSYNAMVCSVYRLSAHSHGMHMRQLLDNVLQLRHTDRWPPSYSKAASPSLPISCFVSTRAATVQHLCVCKRSVVYIHLSASEQPQCGCAPLQQKCASSGTLQ
eukprot:3400-Heterococcus_DN1.PRE.3